MYVWVGSNIFIIVGPTTRYVRSASRFVKVVVFVEVVCYEEGDPCDPYELVRECLCCLNS